MLARERAGKKVFGARTGSLNASGKEVGIFKPRREGGWVGEMEQVPGW